METNQQLAIIKQQAAEVTKSSATIKTSIMDAIRDNSKSLEACVSFGEGLLAETANGMTDDLDTRIASYIKKGKATSKAMAERRKVVTQVFDMVKTGFTQMEKMLDAKSTDSIIYQLQKKRDDYAVWKLDQQRKAEAERQRLARIEAEKNRLSEEVKRICDDILNEQIHVAVSSIDSAFSLLTIDNASTVEKSIKSQPTELKIGAYLAKRKPSYSNELSDDDAKAVMNKAYSEVHAELEKQYTETVTKAIQEKVDLIPSKVKELIEQKHLEEERRRKEEEARKAAEEAKKIADEKARKEAEEKARIAAEEAKKAEEARKAHEEEVRKAEEAAAAERQKQLDEQRKANEQKRELEASKAKANDLFNLSTSEDTSVKAKVTRHIEVKNSDGFMEIIQFWWVHEGAKMSTEDLAKKLGFMVKAAEKVANKTGETIVSDNIAYVEDVKAK